MENICFRLLGAQHLGGFWKLFPGDVAILPVKTGRMVLRDVCIADLILKSQVDNNNNNNNNNRYYHHHHHHHHHQLERKTNSSIRIQSPGLPEEIGMTILERTWAQIQGSSAKAEYLTILTQNLAGALATEAA